jgi:glucose dehydrogenase
VKGLSRPGKTGWLYMLNRETGEPIHKIVEKPVPQNKEQQTTWETQPYPLTDSFVPQDVTEGQYEEIKKLAEETFKGEDIEVTRGEIFDPFGNTMKVLAPGPGGGTNWPPSSYNRNRPAPAPTPPRRSSNGKARSTSPSTPAGNSLAASAHGDNLWLFSLDGELEEVEGGGKGEQGQHAGEETPQPEVEESEGMGATAAPT